MALLKQVFKVFMLLLVLAFVGKSLIKQHFTPQPLGISAPDATDSEEKMATDQGNGANYKQHAPTTKSSSKNKGAKNRLRTKKKRIKIPIKTFSAPLNQNQLNQKNAKLHFKNKNQKQLDKKKKNRKVILPNHQNKPDDSNSIAQEDQEDDGVTSPDLDSDDEKSPPSLAIKTDGGLAQNDNQNSPEYEYWAQRILASPHFKNTTEFIRAYQTNQIDKDVYYQILEEMIDVDDPEMTNLVILAAASTPGSESFEALANVMQSQAPGTNLRAKAENKINTYRSVQYINKLDSVIIQHDNDFAALLATRIIGESAAQFGQSYENQNSKDLEPLENSETKNDPLPNPNPATSSNDGSSLSVPQNANIYQRFLAPLASLAVSADNQDLSNAARFAHKIISDLLNDDPA